MPDAPWSRGPGPTGIPLKSVAPCNSGWNSSRSRYPAKVSRHLQLRLEQLPKPIQDIGWKAQVRLCKRFRYLMARGQHANQVVVAIARELAGFMWAIAKEIAVTP